MFKITRLFEQKVLFPISIILFSVSGLLMFVEAVQRSILNRSFEWASEISIYCMIWSILLMTAHAGKKGQHIRIELVYTKLNKSLKRILFTVVNLISLIFSLILTYSSYLTVTHAYKTQQMSQSTLQIPVWILSSVLIILGVLLFVYYLESLIYSLKNGELLNTYQEY
ncbi:TRAP transporter small permease [Salinibacillus xinjiangensis]|uniref:TRAP transporter small permease subunit n=1 Tax=Salinibacillus xinjiangensis TaxID=1229268 RepID=A0A6G1X1Z3_9BACI|nr:TRAP transporter small permease subunit [Salinibacillus xinjiangensis]